MYEFTKTETGWRIYWGPLPREAGRKAMPNPGTVRKPPRADRGVRLFRAGCPDRVRSDRDSAA